MDGERQSRKSIPSAGLDDDDKDNLDCMYLPSPPYRHDVTQGQFLSEISQFEFRVLNKAKLPVLLYYLSTAEVKIIGFIPFPSVLVQCEMQTVSSRFWTYVVVFIS